MRPITWSAAALIAGGAFTFIVNAGLTPFLQSDVPYPVTAASTVFLWRQSLSALAAILLLIGSIGLYLRQSDRAPYFGAFAFLLAFTGGVLLFANEWCQVFFVRGLALKAPGVLDQLEASKELDAFDVGAIAAISTFTLGWILFSIWMLRTRVFRSRGPVALIAGFFAVPILSAMLPHPVGVIAGNAVLATGWFLLGIEFRNKELLASDPSVSWPR